MTNDSAKPIKQDDFDRPKPIDITTRLRQTRANMLGTDDEQHYWDCHEAAAEIERLRLTDDERQAIKWIIGDDISADGVNIQTTLRGLLERHGATAGRKGD